jgi:sulfur-carrier protein
VSPFATSDGCDAPPGSSQDPVPGEGVPVVLLLFAAARQAAGVARVETSARTVGDVLDSARAAYGERFASVLERSRVWVNGESAEAGQVLAPGDEVAVLPPVSGGSGERAAGEAAPRVRGG